MKKIVLNKELTAKREYDVIVVGGGVAGCAAAVSVAGKGKSVLLLEKTNLLGGLATIGLINMFVPMCNGRGQQIIFGLAEKWIRDSLKYSWQSMPSEWEKTGSPDGTNHRYYNHYSPNIFALQLTEEIVTSGVDLLFDCIGCEPVCEDGRCVGIITDSKAGLEFYGCKMIIDTSGDCDVLRRMGVPTVSGENYYTYVTKMLTLDSCKKAIEHNNIRFATYDYHGGSINLFGDNQPLDMPRWSGLSPEEVTDYLVRNQIEVLNKIRNDDRLSRDIVTLPTMPQFRTTCHIKGDYSLKVSDAYKHFDDSICAINDFEHRNHLFEVSLKTITRRDFPNVITAGRSASGEGYGWDLLRVIPPAILTGQAAGAVACQALDEGVGVADVNVSRLQNTLEGENVMIHFPDEYIPEDRTVIIHGKSHLPEDDIGHI
ncbi:MAG: FAD-dependent oxidoreductase [Clostridia bacterium]|nr:FAD-dependent oxidoreductase [Clostridia bacterium]